MHVWFIGMRKSPVSFCECCEKNEDHCQMFLIEVLMAMGMGNLRCMSNNVCSSKRLGMVQTHAGRWGSGILLVDKR